MESFVDICPVSGGVPFSTIVLYIERQTQNCLLMLAQSTLSSLTSYLHGIIIIKLLFLDLMISVVDFPNAIWRSFMWLPSKY